MMRLLESRVVKAEGGPKPKVWSMCLRDLSQRGVLGFRGLGFRVHVLI